MDYGLWIMDLGGGLGFWIMKDLRAPQSMHFRPTPHAKPSRLGGRLPPGLGGGDGAPEGAKKGVSIALYWRGNAINAIVPK